MATRIDNTDTSDCSEEDTSLSEYGFQQASLLRYIVSSSVSLQLRLLNLLGRSSTNSVQQEDSKNAGRTVLCYHGKELTSVNIDVVKGNINKKNDGKLKPFLIVTLRIRAMSNEGQWCKV